jgi:ComF family protein
MSGLNSFGGKAFNLAFPDDCRICEKPLTDISRIPVCRSCLTLPQPLRAEFFCRSCSTPFADAYPLDERGLCAVCRAHLVNYDSAYSFGSYEGTLRKLIHLFKYAKVETLATPLSKLLVLALPVEQNFDVVAPVPMHWWKKWRRGFNQAELLAAPIARRYGLKLSTCLRRNRAARAQAGLNEAERQLNLKGSFYVKYPEQLANKRVLIVDDVFTTGATLREAARALKVAGASHVAAVTLARVDRRPDVPDFASAAKERRHELEPAGITSL